jgi:uncharacterized membrane-anchored protein
MSVADQRVTRPSVRPIPSSAFASSAALPPASGSTSLLPPSHPQRRELNNEVHARPPDNLVAPLEITYIAMLSGLDQRASDWQHMRRLCDTFDTTLPDAPLNHHSTQLGPVRLTMERHTEFVRYSFLAASSSKDTASAKGQKSAPVPDATTFSDKLPAGISSDWISRIGGEVMVATRVKMIRVDRTAPIDIEAISREHFAGNIVLGSQLGGGIASAFTDFRIHPDGFGRLLVLDGGMPPRMAGRMVQRLLEVDTYRMMALLALPVARGLWPVIEGFERDLVELSNEIATGSTAGEAKILEQLTQLEASVQSQYAEHHYRFSASAAYYDLVQRRIEELRELRIEGLQTFKEFTERRLAPAMNTCRTASANLNELSLRIARTTELLSTRVEITRETQNRQLLQGMARRARLQLRLQQTVEGLSVVAISYYIVGLCSYAAKGLKGAGLKVDTDVLTALSIPVALGVVGFGLRRLSRLVGLERRRAPADAEPHDV